MLASNFGGSTIRSLTVPKDDYLFFSIAGSTAWFYDNDSCDTSFARPHGISDIQYLDLILDAYGGDVKNDVKTISVKVDGVEMVLDKNSFYHKTPLFESPVNADWNVPECDYTGKKAKLINAGFDVLIRLPKGNHTVLVNYDWPASQLSGDITWKLLIE